MVILGIETSCDETAASIVKTENKQIPVTVLSSVLATSLSLHAQTGGIIPEIAAREQVKVIIPVIKQALAEAKVRTNDIDVIAVTYGPGLIGSLLVGVETAKTLAYAWNKPIIPVNHLFGHIYANWIKPHPNPLPKGDRIKEEFPLSGERIKVREKSLSSSLKFRPTLPTFPAIALIVSGGHTDLVLMKNHNNIVWLGGTRDDAAGEAFDKIGRELHFPYPAGPAFEEAARQGNPKQFQFPRPLKHDAQYDFSFSGLKTAAIREIQKIKMLDEQISADLTRGVQDAIIDVLVHKTIKATEAYNATSIVLGGGVAANQTLRDALQQNIMDKKLPVLLHAPEKRYCTDNAAMIATAAYFMGKETSWKKITANPELYFD